MSLSKSAAAIALACGWLLIAGGCVMPYSLEPGDRLDEVRQRVGQPAGEHPTPDGGRKLLYPLGRQAYHHQTVWSYRFLGPFCLLFHVGITPAGIVEGTSYGPDPRCERDRRFL